MRYRIYFLLLLSTTLAEAAEIAPPDLSGKLQQAFCWSSNNDYREPAIYFSDVFEIRVPQGAGPWYSIDMSRVFAAYLIQEHGYVSSVPPDRILEKPQHANIVCSLHDTAAMAQGSKDLLVKDPRRLQAAGGRNRMADDRAAGAGGRGRRVRETGCRRRGSAQCRADFPWILRRLAQDGKQYFSTTLQRSQGRADHRCLGARVHRPYRTAIRIPGNRALQCRRHAVGRASRCGAGKPGWLAVSVPHATSRSTGNTRRSRGLRHDRALPGQVDQGADASVM